MAADILLHHADMVPVGKDQEQHLEMTRDFAQRFNHIYKHEYFKLPVAYNFGSELVKIPGLDGSTKMSKSDNENSCIYLSDTPEVIRKKVMKAVTDAGPQAMNSEKPDVIQNLFTLLEVVSSKDTYNYFNDKWNDCTLRYGDLKKQLAEDIVAATDPIRERIKEFSSNTALLDKIALAGAEKARESASKTLREVRQIIGFKVY
jgi:tryptophanyl-tRNA synthetase